MSMSKIDKIARYNLKNNPLDYITKVASIFHRSDTNIFRLATLSTLQHAIKNYERGIYINVTGSPGKGKSDSLDVMAHLLPEDWTLKSSITAKSLFYMGSSGQLEDVKIVYSDDIHFSEDLIETLKKATSRFSEEINHTTLVKQTPMTLTIPARLTWWFTSVDSLPDDQLASRFINVSVDESEDTDQDVARLMTQYAFESQVDIDNFESVKVCQRMFEILCSVPKGVIAPYHQAIGYYDPQDRRVVASFISILKSVTFMNQLNREKTENGYIISEIEDFKQAIHLFSCFYKTHRTKLSKPELEVFNIIADILKNPLHDGVSIDMIQKRFKRSESRISQILNILLKKAPNLTCEQRSVTVKLPDGSTRSVPKKYYYFTSQQESDMNDMMPKGFLADIYIDVNKVDSAIDSFWRINEEVYPRK